MTAFRVPPWLLCLGALPLPCLERFVTTEGRAGRAVVVGLQLHGVGLSTSMVTLSGVGGMLKRTTKNQFQSIELLCHGC